MNSYAEPVRVGVAGATGYYRGGAPPPARPPSGRCGCRRRWASPGAAPRRVPALKRVWDAPVDGLDLDALADGTRRGVSGAARSRRRRGRAGAARARQARVRSLRRVPSARRRRCGAAGIRRRRSRSAGRLRTDRAQPRSAARLDARRLRRLLSDRRDPRAPAAARRPACVEARRSSSTRSRASRAPARRRPSARTSASATAASRPTACSTIGTPRRSSRSSARRSRSCRTCCRSIAASSKRSTRRSTPGVDEADVAAALQAAYDGLAVRPAHRRRSAGDQARRAHELLRHRLARERRDAAARARRLHRQPRQGRGRPGGAELQRRVRLRRKAGLQLSGHAHVLKLGGELLEDAAAMRAAAAGIAALARDGPARRRARRRPRDRRRPARRAARRRASSTACASPTRTRSTPSSAVLAGRINTAFVAALGAAGVTAVGLTGADAALGLSTLAPALHDDDAGRRRISGSSGVPRDDAPVAAADRPAVARLRAGRRQRRRRRATASC